MVLSNSLNGMSRRLAKMEAEIFQAQHRKVRLFAVEGPKDLAEGVAEAFLRECGHDLRDEDHNIVRIFIAADQDLPLKDVTAECGR